MKQCIVIIALRFYLRKIDGPLAVLSARDTRVDNKIHKKQGLRLGNQNHKDTIKEASEITETFEEPRVTIPHRTDETLKEREMNYSKTVKALARIVHLIGKQGFLIEGYKK